MLITCAERDMFLPPMSFTFNDFKIVINYDMPASNETSEYMMRAFMGVAKSKQVTVLNLVKPNEMAYVRNVNAALANMGEEMFMEMNSNLHEDILNHCPDASPFL